MSSVSDRSVFVKDSAPEYVYVPFLKLHVHVEDMGVVLDIRRELENELFRGRKHGTRHVRNLRCNGPLCAKALRDWMRNRKGSRANARIARYDSLIDIATRLHYNDLEAAKITRTKVLEAPGLLLFKPLV
jgi:hypothetical protein